MLYKITLSSHLRCCFHTLSLVATSDAKKAIKGSYGKLDHTVSFKMLSSMELHWIGRTKSSGTINRILDCQLKLVQSGEILFMIA